MSLRQARCGHGVIFGGDAPPGPSYRDLAREWGALLRQLRRGPGYAPIHALPRGDGHPVIVLPAFLCSDAMFGGLRRWLDALGYAAEASGVGFNLGPSRGLVAAAERTLDRCTDAAGCKASLVGISLGGVLARALAHAHPDSVRRVVTVCSPFRLPTSSPLGPVYRMLAPLHGAQGRMLAHLSAPPPVPTTAIYSPHDGVVAWRSCLDEPGPNRDNVAIDAPHMTMPADPRALQVIAERLSRP